MNKEIPMIIVKLIGGLGNQMFQYAVGRHLAYKNQAKLKLDLSLFKTYKPWKYALSCFNIVEEFATAKDIRLFNLKRRFKIFFKSNKNTLYIEKVKFKFDPEVLKRRGSIYLDGGWQSEKYFKDIEEIIREEFTFKNKPDDNNIKLLESIKNTNSVCIHARRGDYITNSKVNRFHGTCSIDYYNECIQIIRKRVKNPHFFMFSDDPDWIKNNIKIDAPITYVAHNALDKGYEDLRLMKNCKNFIISNGTFSWWGAWLSENKNKIILAPKKWLNVDIRTPDLLPDNWIKI